MSTYRGKSRIGESLYFDKLGTAHEGEIVKENKGMWFKVKDSTSSVVYDVKADEIIYTDAKTLKLVQLLIDLEREES